MSRDPWSYRDVLRPEAIEAIDSLTKRRRRWLFAKNLAILVVFWTAMISVFMLADWFFIIEPQVRNVSVLVIQATVVVTALCLLRSTFRKPTPEVVARWLGSSNPRIGEDLVSAVELSDPERANGSIALQRALQNRAAARVATMDLTEVLPASVLRPWLLAGAAAGILMVVVLAFPKLQGPRRLARAMVPFMDIARVSSTTIQVLAPEVDLRLVAAREPLAIIAEIRHPTVDSDAITPKLQFRTREGDRGEIQLGILDANSDRFQCNLPIGDQPIAFRIRAIDGLTAWQWLTPRTRPTAIEFVKDLVPPPYTRLPPTTLNENHGNIEAIEGTQVNLAVTFDQPVHDARLMIGIDQQEVLHPVEDDETSTQFSATLPIDKNTSYRVDALSIETSLDQPRGEVYSIISVPDQAPLVQFADEVPEVQTASVRDVLSFPTFVKDDIPIEDVTLSINQDGQTLDVPASVPEESSEFKTSIRFDLGEARWRGEPNENSTTASSKQDKIRPGDFLTVFARAVDRAGQAAQSRMIRIIVTDDQFRADRHDRLDQQLALIRQTLDELSDVQQPKSDAERESVSTTIQEFLPMWLQSDGFRGLPIGRGLDAWRISISLSRLSRPIGNESARMPKSIKELQNWLSMLAGQLVTEGLQDDLLHLINQFSGERLQTLQGPDAQLVANRTGAMVRNRLMVVSNFLADRRDGIGDSTNKRFDNFDQWVQRWIDSLEDGAESENKDLLRLRLIDLHRELIANTRHSTLDSNLPNTLNRAMRESFRDDQLNIETDQLSRSGKQQEKDAFSKLHSDIIERLQQRHDITRALLPAATKYAGDLHLMKLAIENVGKSGFQDFEDVPATEVYEQLGQAMATLQAIARIRILGDSMWQLHEPESQLIDDASTRLHHPLVVERFGESMQEPIRQLQRHGTDWSILEPLDRVRYGEAFQSARNRTSSRRWSHDEMLSAAQPIKEIYKSIQAFLLNNQVLENEARQTILRFAPSLKEQAKQLANESRDQSKSNEGVIESTKDLAQRLNDIATERQLGSLEEREVAQAADQAANQMLDSLSKLVRHNKTNQPQSELATDATREELSQKADELADRISDQSPNQLPPESTKQSMDSNDYENGTNVFGEQNEAMAQAAQQNPEILLNQIESQLRRNPELREEVEAMTQQLSDSVRRDLDQIARDGEQLVRDFERSDTDLLELKKQLLSETQDAERFLRSLADRDLSTLQAAIGASNTPAAQEAASETADSLREIANELRRDQRIDQTRQTLLDRMARVSKSMSAVQDQLNRVGDQLDDRVSDPIHGAESNRNRQVKQLEQQARSLRDSRIRTTEAMEREWTQKARGDQRSIDLINRQIQALKRQNESTRKQIEKSKKESQKRNLERALDQRSEQLKQRQSEKASLEESLADSEARRSRAKSLSDKEQAQRTPKLDAPNPSAQWSKTVAERARSEVEEIANRLNDAVAKLQGRPQLESTPSAIKDADQRQQQLAQRASQAQQMLDRLQRHTERLADAIPAMALDEKLSSQKQTIADANEQMMQSGLPAERSAAEASQQANQASQQSSSSPDDARGVADKIKSAAESMSQIAQAMSSGSNTTSDSSQGQSQTSPEKSNPQPGDTPSQARLMAKAMDELDAASQSPSGDAAPSTAAESSSALSQMLAQHVQQAASQRQSALDQAMQGKNASQPSASQSDAMAGGPQTQSSENSETKPSQPKTDTDSFSSQAGSAEGLAKKNLLDISGVSTLGDDWATLRDRDQIDAGRGSRAEVPAEYREDVRVYFETLARESSSTVTE